MERKSLVLMTLKPLVKALGFSNDELKGVAAYIADNLKSGDDAEEADVRAEVETFANSIMPILSVGQKQANRVINERLAAQKSSEQTVSAKGNEGKQVEEDMPTWARSLAERIQDVTDKMAAMTAERTTSSRRGRLSEVLDGTGLFGKRTLANFDKMRFDSDDDFETFLRDVTEDAKAFTQQRADENLQNMTAPRAVNGGQLDKGVLSDSDIDKLAETLV